MVNERTFIHYQVKLQLTKNTRIDLWQGDYLTPYITWEEVDLPYWTTIKEQSLRDKSNSISSIRVEKITQIANLYRFEGNSSTSMEKRRELNSKLEVTDRVNSTSLGLKDKDIDLANDLAGRKLLLQEVFSVWQQRQEQNEDLLTQNKSQINGKEYQQNFLVTLQKLYLQGFFDWLSAVGKGTNTSFCRRCGYGEEKKLYTLDKFKLLLRQQEQLIRVECQNCGQEDCFFCPRCLEMGRVKACQPLLSWSADIGSNLNNLRLSKAPQLEAPELDVLRTLPCESVPFNWQGKLSLAQQEASTKLFNFVHATPALPTINNFSGNNAFLVWAVCGAGKTEILFETIHHSLLKQQKVLITSPRRDVILELAPRLKEAFPQTTVRTLHAESTEKFLSGDLFLATTHQTLRFKHFFDLMIIDEEDAFPFHHDPMLPYAVKRAKKPKAPIVYLTATPRSNMIRQVKEGQLEYVLISKRYHGHPLAVPDIKPIGAWRKHIEKRTLLTPLMQYVTHLARHQRYGYLFVPHVRDLALVQEYLQETVVPYLQKQPTISTTAQVLAYLQSINIEVVHAEHPDRTEIVQRFRKQQIHILLTTTILERGVTIPFSDVAILGSDDPIFDRAALIQIAGRVGRKLEDPVGNVWFFPEARTNAQLHCIEQIKRWNKQ